MIKVEKLSKSFGATDAVKELSFDLKPGEILGLLGPNGAGKTTTLRAIAGVLRVDAGEVFIGNFGIKTNPVEAKRILAYLPDQSSYFDYLTCWEHIRFVANVYQVSDWESKAEKLFERFQLASKKSSFSNELSKGMKQRLGLIAAFLHDPKFILFDEPMTGLDPAGIRTLNEMIRERAAAGAGFILSSHLLSILEEVCTKVLVIHKGECRLFGSLEEVRAKMKDVKKNASLEEIFLYATQDKDVA